MKFIHLADAHLDSPFLGLSFLPSKSSLQIHQAPNKSFTRIVDLALKEEVDLVLIAGDTFDSARPNPSTQIFFAEQIERLTKAQIQVVMIFGNHDHMAEADLLVPESQYFKLLGNEEKIESITCQTKTGFTYDVTGFSYLNNHITEDKVSKFPSKAAHYTFGLMHAQEKTNQSAQDVYAPFSLTTLKDLNYDYFALGHIHLRQVLAKDPWIVYSGNIQGRHINETDKKGCYLGEINEQTKETTIQFVQTCPIVWQQQVIKLNSEVSQTELQNLIIDALNPNKTTYFCLQISGAEYLNDKERELIQENDFWRMISNQLDYDSQLVDIRLSSNSQLKIAESDLAFFNQAEKELFATDEFAELSKDWAKKDGLSNQLENAPDFLQEVKELAEVKLNSKLKGISDEVKEN